MRQPHSPLLPEEGESLATFLRRAQQERQLTVPKLVAALSSADGDKSDSSWERQVKAWRSGVPPTVNEENAGALGEVLEADFSRFVFDPTDRAWRDTLTEIRAEIVSLRDRVAALEESQSDE